MFLFLFHGSIWVFFKAQSDKIRSLVNTYIMSKKVKRIKTEGALSLKFGLCGAIHTAE